MKVLITGAAGGIGSSISNYLKKDYQLVLVDNLRNGHLKNLNNDLIDRLYKCDINSFEFEEIFKSEKPDIVIHLAAVTSLPDCETNVSDCFRINVEGTASVLNCCKKYGVSKFIFSSTSAIYENNITINGFKEDDETNPTLFYSLSKKMAEDICRSYRDNYKIDIVIFRLFNVFGPNQDIHRKNPPLINYIVRELSNNREPILHSDGNQSRDYVYIDDVIKAIEKSFTHKFEDDYLFNLCSGKIISVNEIVSLIKNTKDEFKNIKVIFKPSNMLWDTYPKLFEGEFSLSKERVSKETNKFSIGSSDKFKNTFGWTPSKEIKDRIKYSVNEIIKKNKL
jgi:nucleoside-diphosphate-sugar epimerase